MIAGLLGEHLASPRTASKTNQNTALEPKTDRPGGPSSKEEFASMVNDDVDRSRNIDRSSDTDRSVRDPNATDAPPAQQPVPSETASPANAETVDAEFRFQATANGDGESVLIVSDEAIAQADLDRQPRATTLAETPASQVAAQAAETAAAGDTPDTLASADTRRQAETTPPTQGLRTRVTRDATLSNVAADPTRVDATASDPARRADMIAIDSAPVERVSLDAVEADVPRGTPRAENVDVQIKTGTIPTPQAQVTDIATLVRDASAGSVDTPTTFTAAPTQTAQSAAPAAVPTGMTPTAASIPIASPNELMSIVLNAINNGIDPQEQLVVQLDPPELGRVMIDFKFDAQGLQQIMITAENPEALKRLREMHFELTQALREQGLSDQNMSFQQDTQQERSHDAWTSSASDAPRREAAFSSVGTQPLATAVSSPEPRSSGRDRLDLTL